MIRQRLGFVVPVLICGVRAGGLINVELGNDGGLRQDAEMASLLARFWLKVKTVRR